MKRKPVKALLPAAFLLVLLTVFTGCEKKEAVSAATFKSVMEGQGYTVTDLTDQATGEGIEQILLAENNEKDINIRLTVADSDGRAKQLFKTDVDAYEAAEPQFKTTADVGNYNSYKASFNNEQVYVVEFRVDNTLMSGAGDLSKKDKVDEIFNGFNN